MSEPCTLRIWLAGPLQAWGTTSRFEVRTTDLRPSKSGVIGLLCAALGRGRDQPVEDLAALRFGVRIEQPGSVLRDFHTVGAGTDPVAVASGGTGRGIVTQRYYLQDAAFAVGLEGTDPALAERLRDALLAPRWTLALGRRSCPPAGPLVDDGSLAAADLETALREDWRPAGARGERARDAATQLVIEQADGDLVVDDQPLGERRFAPRRMSVHTIEPEVS